MSLSTVLKGGPTSGGGTSIIFGYKVDTEPWLLVPMALQCMGFVCGRRNGENKTRSVAPWRRPYR